MEVVGLGVSGCVCRSEGVMIPSRSHDGLHPIYTPLTSFLKQVLSMPIVQTLF